MLEIATNQVPKLPVIANLFEALHKHEIVYCNLKGNEQHLRISMTGQSDIDILFDHNQKVKLEPVLDRLGFKEFNAIKEKQYKDIVDFIALDSESGKIIHLHTYYRLTLGEPYLKGYQLDIENNVLDSRLFNEEFRMYCIRPAFELVFLYLTESLKLRHRDFIAVNLNRKKTLSAKVLYEYNWLKRRANDAEIEGILKAIFIDHVEINSLMKAEFNRRQLLRIAPVIKKEFSRYRLYSPLSGLLLRWYRETTVIVFRKLSRFLDHPILSKRINPRGGIIVAVTGSGKAGKSHVANLLKETFEQKLDVYKVNFGRPESRTSMVRKLRSRISFFGDSKDREQQKQSSPGNDNFLRSVYNCIQALIDIRQKSHNMKLVQIAKKKGALVICDRYPQNEIMGYSDGPVLHDLLSSKNIIFRTVARIESNTYTHSLNHSPDILFKLVDDHPEKRRPEETVLVDNDPELAAGIEQLSFNNKCKVILVDAAKPLNEVLYTIKKEIWNIL